MMGKAYNSSSFLVLLLEHSNLTHRVLIIMKVPMAYPRIDYGKLIDHPRRGWSCDSAFYMIRWVPY